MSCFCKNKGSKPNFDENLETEQLYKERWRSIYIVYFTMFLVSLGFSIIVTGVWPYLDKLDPTAGKEFMGYVVAANPFGQMLFSPVLGWISNRLGSIRIPLIITLIIFTMSSIFYSSLELFETNRKYWMLWTRFFVGVSSANVVACRSYLSAATLVSERTQAVSMISLAQVLGFIVGPAIQAAVVPLGSEGYWLINNKLNLNMYTASGWINAVLSTITMFLYLPQVFKEHKIAVKEAMHKLGKDNEKDTWKAQKPNYFAAWTLIIAFFIIVFNFMLLETIGTPLTMDQFAWSKSESLKYMGILLSVAALLSIGTFASIGPLSRRFSEVKIMIWGGFFFMVLGRLSYIPFASEPAQTYDDQLKVNLALFCKYYKSNSAEPAYSVSYLNETLTQMGINFNPHPANSTELKEMTFDCGEELLGCPKSQTWCSQVPALTLTQFLIGFLLTALGYPIGVTLIQTIFSKLLGSRPQGVWMGYITGAGCLSRIMGPVCVTFIYEKLGTVWTFGMTTVMMALCLGWLWYFWKQLVPEELPKADQELTELVQNVEVEPSQK